MAKTRKSAVEEPRTRGRLFWICVLVLLEIVLWTVLSVVGVSEAIATAVALAGGAAFVVAFRDRIWGEDWREQLERSRAPAAPSRRQADAPRRRRAEAPRRRRADAPSRRQAEAPSRRQASG